MAGPEALGKAKLCPFIQSANPVNRCHECQLGIRTMSEAKEAEHKRNGRNVSGHTHVCTMAVLAGKFAGPMVKEIESLANVIEGHIQAIEKYLTESVDAQVAAAVEKAMKKTSKAKKS